LAPYVLTVIPDTNLSFNKHLVIMSAESVKYIANQYVYQTEPVEGNKVNKYLHMY
jgi:hypothetical protein